MPPTPHATPSGHGSQPVATSYAVTLGIAREPAGQGTKTTAAPGVEPLTRVTPSASDTAGHTPPSGHAASPPSAAVAPAAVRKPSSAERHAVAFGGAHWPARHRAGGEPADAHAYPGGHGVQAVALPRA